MKKPQKRTMWMVPRNIRRIEPWKLVQILTLLEAIDGSVGNQEHQDKLYKALEDLQVKATRSAAGSKNQGGFRTYLTQLACLGLYACVGDQYELTVAGKEMIEGKDPRAVLRCQLMRMQYPSYYGSLSRVRMSETLRVKPFVFLLKLFEDERIQTLSDEEMAVAVIYGRTDSDYEKVVGKILRMKAGAPLSSVVDDVADVCTPSRYPKSDEAEEISACKEQGCTDAATIANTFKNFLLSAALIYTVPQGKGAKKRYASVSDEETLRAIKPYREEPIRPYDPKNPENWQRFFGRWNKKKTVGKVSTPASARDGFKAMVQNECIKAMSDNPYAFDLAAFARTQAERWHKPEQDIVNACAPLKDKARNIERNAVEEASVSGGGKSGFFEKAVLNIFVKLGFERSENWSQKKPADRRPGGYPDTYIYAKGMKSCGLADAKSTSKYSFPIGDRTKLGTYYKHCELEVYKSTPSEFFVYVAGGFDGTGEVIAGRLRQCRKEYERPVSAVTVSALMDLIEEDPPEPEKLFSALRSGKYFNASYQIRDAIDKDAA
jgi:hypothetical protein